jgi:large conductance mechanosensitive channel
MLIQVGGEVASWVFLSELIGVERNQKKLKLHDSNKNFEHGILRAMLDEFKAFVSRSNVVDLAVGVVTGAAFGKIVSSLVADVLMPPIGLLIGGVNFSELAFTLKAASGSQPAVLLRYGAFFNTIIDFLIISAAIFMFVKLITRISKNAAGNVLASNSKPCPECLMDVPKAAKRCGHCGSILTSSP